MSKRKKAKEIKEETVDLHLRLPFSLWESIKTEAKQQGRTLNGQIKHFFTTRYQPLQPAKDTDNGKAD